MAYQNDKKIIDNITVKYNSNYVKFLRTRKQKLEKVVLLETIMIFLLISIVIFASYSYYEESKMLESFREENINTIERLTKAEQDKKEIIDELTVKLEKMGIVTDLSNVVYLEAGGQGRQGMQYVMDCIVNRVSSPQFPGTKTLKTAISSPHQFNALNYLDRITPTVKESANYKIAKEVVINTLIYGSTSEVLFFMNPDASDVANRGWMRTKEFLFKYKQHEFYK